MSDAARWAGALLITLVAAGPAAAEPQVSVLDLPFRVAAMRGPTSEVAVAVATSGLLPLARPRPGDPVPETGEEDRAPVVVVWGEGGGAALSLAEGQIRTTLLGAEAIEGLAAAETPRGALPGSRRALAGALSAYLTGPTRGGGGLPGAAALTIRERQPMAVSADPKPVPVTTATVPAGADAVFSTARPRALRLAGKPAFLAATLEGTGGGLALIGRKEGADWAVLARMPVQAGGPVRLAAVGPFSAPGAPQAAAVRADGTLQVWSLAADALALVGEAPGYGAGPPEADLAALVEPDKDGPAELALPAAGGTALAVVGFKGGPPRERLRAPLPAPAATGVAALGRGASSRLLVGLADGRVAVVAP
ncbi:hypothetical protein [Methylobacterium dankookense]|uniref:Uncharacterized protein n=1 Tax=Methylobacterium dankookense TaxID=560405 RepID=A0A564G846_9HYPH|nr:hypothetical protein [Methylobacterium dankookense]GJD58465.1 hypothetical protein IFDJLNFL_4386 [Methylobacterium dankookense]VUF15980.1 hypothetical protein MTDSW087_05729 [Methylobacterium dankookense]